jgi:hypothetical protein
MAAANGHLHSASAVESALLGSYEGNSRMIRCEKLTLQ